MPKLAHLRALVESLVIDQGRKIIVFSQWRRMLSLSHWAMAVEHGDQLIEVTAVEERHICASSSEAELGSHGE